MSPRPNLLFILADQQRFASIGANGLGGAHTPVLDALAGSGVNLQEYFTNCPVCVPSRATLFTGRYPHSHQARENYSLMEAGREVHLFRILKQAGYRIGYCGKNHLVDDQEKGNFDWFDARGSESPAPEELPLIEQYRTWRVEESGVPLGTSEIWRTGYVHDEPPERTRAWQTAQAGIEFLQLQGRSGATDPFCLCVSFEDPHVPHLARREFYELHAKEPIEVPGFAGEDELAARAKRWLIKYGAMNARAATVEDKRRYIAIYRAMISWVDAQVGRILNALDATGRRADTLVVFTSDHGDFCFNHGLPKKDLVLADDLLHVPCIFSWPGRLRPHVPSHALVEQVDMLPTILELLGLEVPLGVQGRSFAGLLHGARTTHKDAVFAEICPPYLYCKYRNFDEFAAENGGRGRTPFNVPGDFCKSIRERGLRYVWYGTGEEELYDLAREPAGRRNVAAEPEMAAVKSRLKMRLLEWNALTEDPLDANLRRDLQAHYDRWSPRSIQPGKAEQPPWKETARMRLAKPIWPDLP